MIETFVIKHTCGHFERHDFWGLKLSHCAAAARQAKELNCSDCFSKLPIVKEAKKLDVL